MPLSKVFPQADENTHLANALLRAMLVGLLDYITGYEVSFFLFYMWPILYAVWHTNQKSTILVVLVCAIIWWWADWQAGHPYISNWLQVYETLVRLVFFSFVAFSGSAIRTQRASMEAQIAYLRRMRELERDIVNASEREQQRIGQDLHDGLCQFLAGITCMAGSLRDDLAARFLPEAEVASEIHDLVKGAVVQARDIARGISPVHMDESGLVSALEELAGHISTFHEVDCRVQSCEDFDFPDRESATHLYRIAQEAASNAVRHGHARTVRIHLEQAEQEEIVLLVIDDGAGFNVEQVHGDGMGLRTMRYRAAALRGTLDIKNDPEGGMIVCCRAPMPGFEPKEPQTC